ncbi:MAG: DcrB-related protein [Chthoniobacterales bacterium]
MKKILLLVAGLIGLIVIFFGVKQMSRGVHEMTGASSPPPQELGETYTSMQNGYSFRIPKGWETKSGSQPGMMMISAPKDSGLASNMVTTSDPFKGSLTDYIEANKEALRKDVPTAKIVNDTAYATEAKVTAHKVKLQNKVNEMDLVQTMYFFEGPEGRKVIVTCTTPAKFDGQLESLFDQSMKTFAFATP